MSIQKVRPEMRRDVRRRNEAMPGVALLLGMTPLRYTHILHGSLFALGCAFARIGQNSPRAARRTETNGCAPRRTNTKSLVRIRAP
jgi:hypothetical protein